MRRHLAGVFCTLMCRYEFLRPDHAVVSNKSLVNKDFSTYRKAVLLAGSPAKVIKEHCSHIRSSKLEKEIDKFFKDNKEKTLYKFDMK